MTTNQPYRVKQRESDGVWCIYLPTYNAVIAEFSAGTDVDAQRIKAILEGNMPVPKINITCECSDGVARGSTNLNVVRVEQEDDGSFTAFTDHWPKS